MTRKCLYRALRRNGMKTVSANSTTSVRLDGLAEIHEISRGRLTTSKDATKCCSQWLACLQNASHLTYQFSIFILLFVHYFS